MAYKHAFSRQYPIPALGSRSLDEAFVLQADGRLTIEIDGEQESIALLDGGQYTESTLLFIADSDDWAVTHDQRYGVQIVSQPYGDTQEYWLHHVDRATGRNRRTRLSAEYHDNNSRRPRVTVRTQHAPWRWPPFVQVTGDSGPLPPGLRPGRR